LLSCSCFFELKGNHIDKFSGIAFSSSRIRKQRREKSRVGNKSKEEKKERKCGEGKRK
jgi:hypothetical protein